jgi:glycine cleavage system H lipoate-binding protein
VWIGKYPKALISNIYSVSSAQPEKVEEVKFIKWVLTDGQQFLYGNGYSDLLAGESQSAVDKLYNARIYAGTTPTNTNLKQTALLLIIILLVTGVIINTLAHSRNSKNISVELSGPAIQGVLNETALNIPAGLYYSKTHTWAFMDQNGIVKVGVDDFMQRITGPITRIKMKQKGEKVKPGEAILSVIQNGKQISLYAPVSGTIIEFNKTLEKNSSLINTSPYSDGWVYKIEPSNWSRENQLLFMAEKHKQYIINEFTRLKDFLAFILMKDSEKYGAVVLQDGGELRDGVLSSLGPEEWEDFQTKFIDPSRQLWFYEIY